MSVTDPTYSTSTSVDLPLSVTAARYNSVTTNLELVHYYAATPTTSDNAKISKVIGTGAGWYTGVFTDADHITLVKNGETNPFAKTGTTVQYAVYTITIGAPVENYTDTSTGIVYTPTDIMNKLAGKNISLSIAALESDGTTSTRAKFYSLGTAANEITSLPATSGSTSVNDNTLSLPAATASVGDWKLEISFGLYADGDSATADSGTVSANFRMTVDAR